MPLTISHWLPTYSPRGKGCSLTLIHVALRVAIDDQFMPFLINIGSEAGLAPSQLFYNPYKLDNLNIEPIATSPLLRCRALRALGLA